jgi:hypothetical protein
LVQGKKKWSRSCTLFYVLLFFNQGWNIIKYIEKYHRGTQYIKINTIKNKYPEQNWYSLTKTNKLQRINQNSWNHVHQMFVETLDRSLKILHKLAPRVTIWAKGLQTQLFPRGRGEFYLDKALDFIDLNWSAVIMRRLTCKIFEFAIFYQGKYPLLKSEIFITRIHTW